jgi:hypothetical protein
MELSSKLDFKDRRKKHKILIYLFWLSIEIWFRALPFFNISHLGFLFFTKFSQPFQFNELSLIFQILFRSILKLVIKFYVLAYANTGFFSKKYINQHYYYWKHLADLIGCSLHVISYFMIVKNFKVLQFFWSVARFINWRKLRCLVSLLPNRGN